MRLKYLIIALLLSFTSQAQITVNTFFEVITGNPMDSRDSLTTLADTSNYDSGIKYPGLLAYAYDVSQLWMWNGTKWVFLFDETGSPNTNIAVDTTVQLTYLPSHNYTDGVLYAIKADLTRASAEFADSIHTAFIVGAPDVDSVQIQYAGRHTQTGHGYAVGKLYYLTDDTADQFDTIPGSFTDPVFIVLDANTLELLNQGTDVNSNIIRRVIPSPFITAYGGDPFAPTDSVIQAVIEGVYVPTGRAAPGTIFLTQRSGASRNPAHVASAADPSTPANMWYWDGALATRNSYNKYSICLSDTSYGTLFTLTLDTVQLINGIPTDSTVADWLETNYTDNNLRLTNGTLLYWVGSGTKRSPDYIWEVVDDLTPDAVGTDQWDNIIKRITAPGGQESSGLVGELQYSDGSGGFTSNSKITHSSNNISLDNDDDSGDVSLSIHNFDAGSGLLGDELDWSITIQNGITYRVRGEENATIYTSSRNYTDDGTNPSEVLGQWIVQSYTDGGSLNTNTGGFRFLNTDQNNAYSNFYLWGKSSLDKEFIYTGETGGLQLEGYADAGISTAGTYSRLMGIQSDGTLVPVADISGGGGAIDSLHLGTIANQIDTIVFFGNSITVNLAVGDPNKRWPNIVASNHDAYAHNLAASGTRMQNSPASALAMINRIGEIPSKRNTNLAIVFLYGANDMQTGTGSAAQFQADYQEVIDSCIARGWSSSEIIVITPTPLTTGGGAPQSEQDEYNAATNALTSCTIVDVYTPLSVIGVSNFTTDGTHPEELGSSIIASYVSDAIDMNIKSKGQKVAINGTTELDTLVLRNLEYAVDTLTELLMLEKNGLIKKRNKYDENWVFRHTVIDVANDMSANGFTIGRGNGNGDNAIFASNLSASFTGNFVTIFGDEAGESITTGNANSLFGWRAGSDLTAGARNSFFGYRAGERSTIANDNTAVGYQSMLLNTTGASNTAIGQSSLYNNTSGASNIAMGRALFANTTGSQNIAIGDVALFSAQTTSGITAIGTFALQNFTTGSNIGAVGLSALVNMESGSDTYAMGASVGNNVKNTNKSVLLGTRAGSYVNFDNVIAIGYESANRNPTTNSAVTVLDASTDVDISNEQVTITGHGKSWSGWVYCQVTGTNLPSPLVSNSFYAVRVIDANTLEFDRNLTTTGSGTFTIADQVSIANSIAIGSNSVVDGEDQIALGDGTHTELRAGNFEWNIDQSTSGKDGYVMSFNESTGQIELKAINETLADTDISSSGDSATVDLEILGLYSRIAALEGGTHLSDLTDGNVSQDGLGNTLTISNANFDFGDTGDVRFQILQGSGLFAESNDGMTFNIGSGGINFNGTSQVIFNNNDDISFSGNKQTNVGVGTDGTDGINKNQLDTLLNRSSILLDTANITSIKLNQINFVDATTNVTATVPSGAVIGNVFEIYKSEGTDTLIVDFNTNYSGTNTNDTLTIKTEGAKYVYHGPDRGWIDQYYHQPHNLTGFQFMADTINAVIGVSDITVTNGDTITLDLTDMVVLEQLLPFGVDSLINRADSTVMFDVLDGQYGIRIQFDAQTATSSNAGVLLGSNGAALTSDDYIINRSFTFPKGTGVVNGINMDFGLFASQASLDGSLKFYLTATVGSFTYANLKIYFRKQVDSRKL